MILCCGDALIDMVPTPLPDGATGYRPCCGGSCLNTAVALARLGTTSGFVGGLSRDFLGDVLAAYLRSEGVDLGRSTFSDDETTLGLVSLDTQSPRYVFYDRSSAGRRWAPSAQALDLDGVEAVHLGSVTLVGEPSAGNYEDYMRYAASHSVLSLDPNCRPTLVDDLPAYRARIDRMARMADLVRMSDEDAEFLHPGRPLDAVAGELLDAGVSLAVLTRGAQGATAYSQSVGAITMPARPTEVADTIAAGDTFMAALLTWLRDRGHLTKASLRELGADEMRGGLAYAVRAAALACARVGANPPYRADVDLDCGVAEIDA